MHPPRNRKSETGNPHLKLARLISIPTAYAMIQSTKPQSLAHGLNDSPAGLAAWIVEKLRASSDCGGAIESRFTKDELLTHIMIYWTTESIGSSFMPYYDFANAGALTWIKEGVKKWTGSS